MTRQTVPVEVTALFAPEASGDSLIIVHVKTSYFGLFSRRVRSIRGAPHQIVLIEFLLNRSVRRVNRNSINSTCAKLTTIRQIKAARALLGWSQADLARHSDVSEPTIARLEAAEGQLGGRGDTVKKIRTALETSGIEFIEENGAGEGVRLRKPRRAGRK